MKQWKPYLSAFRLRALLETQYRGAAFGGQVTQLFFAMVLILLYEALYDGKDPAAFAQVVSYVWLQQMLFRALFSSEGELSSQIMSGGVAYSLIRPVDQQAWWFCRTLALKVVGCLMRLVPMLLAQVLLPPVYRLQLPDSPLALAQFLVSLCLGMLCLTQIASISDGMTMITLDRRGVSSIINLSMAALSGNIVPLTLFPEKVQSLIRYQPFAQALDAPIRMYQHQQALPDFTLSLAVQALWLAVLTLCARMLWRRQLRSMVVQGG